ncbi:MAG TPA: hypothetical protein VFS43_36390 [Polyangiaceae bacterium]|nr:hypothetical protein [Polyangiaceae bacterium]
MAALPSLKKVLWSVAGFAAASTALMGFAHTKPGRPLLALMAGGKKPVAEQAVEGGGSSCPLGFSKPNASEKDAALKKEADRLRGTERALAKPALAFELEKTTKADVESWAKSNQVACRAPKAMADLDCSNVPARLLSGEKGGPDAKSVWFTFDSRDRLVSLTAIRYDRDPGTAASLYDGTVRSLSKAAGPPAASEGDSSAEYLAAGLWRQATANFAFNDYYAKTSVTHIRQGEFMFVEEYRALPN